MEEEKKGQEVEEGAHSLLCKVRSDGEAGGPQCSHAKHRLDGGPGAAEERVSLSVIELHEGILGERKEQSVRQAQSERQTGRQTVNVHSRVSSNIHVFRMLLRPVSRPPQTTNFLL